MAVIKTVAVLGATGNIGTYITNELVKAGFEVTALTRSSPSSITTLPSSVTIKQVDTSSAAALTEAFKGQDAVVSATGTMAVGTQDVQIEAAVAAGVGRFIPSEFGTNSEGLTPELQAILGVKGTIIDSLKARAAESGGKFTWTALSTSSFFEFGFDHPVFGIDIPGRKATIYDSGNEPTTPTTMPQIGRAVAAILQRPDETANTYLAVTSFVTSQNELLRLVEEEVTAANADGKPVKFDVTRVSAKDTAEAGRKSLAAGNVFGAFYDLLAAFNYEDGANRATTAEQSANKLLGLEEEDVRAAVRAKVAAGVQFAH